MGGFFFEWKTYHSFEGDAVKVAAYGEVEICDLCPPALEERYNALRGLALVRASILNGESPENTADWKDKARKYLKEVPEDTLQALLTPRFFSPKTIDMALGLKQ